MVRGSVIPAQAYGWEKGVIRIADRVSISHVRDLSVAVVITVLLGTISAYIPFWGFFSIFLWAVPITVLTVKSGIGYGVMGVTVAGILLALFINPGWSAFTTVQIGSLGLLVGYLLRRGSTSGHVIVAGTAVAVFTTGLLLFLPLLLGFFHGSGLDNIYNRADEIVEIWQEMGLLDQLQQQGITRKEIEESVRRVVDWITKLLPSIVIVTAAGSAFINFLVARAILLRIGFTVPYFPPFKEWRVPWFSSWIVIFGLGLALLGDYLNVKPLLIFGQNILYLYLPVALAIGLSVGVYVYSNFKSQILKLAVLFSAFFYLPLTAILLVFLGIFDPLIDFRKFQSRKDKE